MSEENETSTIRIDKPEGGEFVFVIKPLSIPVYLAMQKNVRLGKIFEAYILVLTSLKVDGDDPNALMQDKYLSCLMALDGIMAEMIQPCEASIKKN